MNIPERYQQQLKGVKLAFDSPSELEDRASSILLFRHHLTTLLEWKKMLGNDSEYVKDFVSQNLFLDLQPPWLPEINTLEDFIRDLDHMGVKLRIPGRAMEALFAYLYTWWEVFKHTPEISQYGLPNPYEAVMKLIGHEKGIGTSNGRFVINAVTFSMLPKFRYFKLPSLEEPFLDFIDARYNFFENKIPNAAETMQLWQEFLQSA